MQYQFLKYLEILIQNTSKIWEQIFMINAINRNHTYLKVTTQSDHLVINIVI